MSRNRTATRRVDKMRHARRHRCHLRTRCARPLHRGPGGGRPVGRVVRSVPHAGAHPREGGRRHRRQGGAGQGRRRRQPPGRVDLPGAVHPRRLRARRTARSSTRSSARCPSRRCRSSSTGWRRSRPRPTAWSRRATRRRCARRSSSSPTTRARWPRSPSCSSVGATRDEALALLERIPETAETRRVAALARVGDDVVGDDGMEARLDALLERVKDDDDARQQFVDLLEVLGADDPRTATYRKRLTARLVLSACGSGGAVPFLPGPTPSRSGRSSSCAGGRPTTAG